MPDVHLRRALAAATGQLGPISVNDVLRAIGHARPIGCAALAAAMQPLPLTADLDSGTCHGSCELIFEPNGHVTFAGHVHNAGIVDARYTVITSIPMTQETGADAIAVHQGTVGGTLSPLTSSDDQWHETTRSALVRDHWWSLRTHIADSRTQFGTSIGLYEAFISSLGPGTPTWIFRL